MFLFKSSISFAKKHYTYIHGIKKTVKSTKVINKRYIYLHIHFSKLKCLQLDKFKINTYIQTPICVYREFTPLNVTNPTLSINSNFNLYLSNKCTLWTSLRFAEINDRFIRLVDLKTLKSIYTPSYGLYALLVFFNHFKSHFVFKLPSSKKIYVTFLTIGLLGEMTLKNKKNIIYKFHNYVIRKKQLIVRGVAKNPVDHHNGGRAKRKPLFLNKFNNVAKCNK